MKNDLCHLTFLKESYDNSAYPKGLGTYCSYIYFST